MKLVRDWRRVLRRAWSVRLLVLATAANGLAAVWFVFSDDIPEWLFVVGGILLPIAALVARLIDQPSMRDEYE